MIKVTDSHLSSDQQEQIREWLNLPGCQAFLKWLKYQASAKTAEAGNKLVEDPDQESNVIEAKRLARRAMDYNETARIIGTAKVAESFTASELNPEPLTEEET